METIIENNHPEIEHSKLSLDEVKQELRKKLTEEQSAGKTSHLLNAKNGKEFDVDVLNQTCADLYNITSEQNRGFNMNQFENKKIKLREETTDRDNDEKIFLEMFIAYINNRATVLKARNDLKDLREEVRD